VRHHCPAINVTFIFKHLNTRSAVTCLSSVFSLLFFEADLFENVYGSPLKKREPEDVRGPAELRGHQPLNNITVSKKRNWLYQSTLRSQSLDESKRSQDRRYFSLSPVSPPKHWVSHRPHCTHAVCNAARATLSRNGSSAFSEDNDADDEGEIWYNPIPEDDSLGIAHVLSLEEANTAALKLPVSMLSARDLMKAEPPSEDRGDVQTSQSNGINSADSMHSTEIMQHCKQRLGHRTQESPTAEDSPVLKSASTGKGGCSPEMSSFSGLTFPHPAHR
jgi:hypothetical protein